MPKECSRTDEMQGQNEYQENAAKRFRRGPHKTRCPWVKSNDGGQNGMEACCERSPCSS